MATGIPIASKCKFKWSSVANLGQGTIRTIRRMTKEDSKRKSFDIPDVTTTFQSVTLLEANKDQAQVHEDDTRKG